jgi:hypothetical protein
MEIEEINFKSSNLWLQNFKTQINIAATVLHGEGGRVNRNDPMLLEELAESEEQISIFH